MPYDDIGRMWGNEDAHKTAVAEFDADAKATLSFLSTHAQVAPVSSARWASASAATSPGGRS